MDCVRKYYLKVNYALLPYLQKIINLIIKIIIKKMDEWHPHQQKRNIFFCVFVFWFPVEPPVLCSILGKESITLLQFEHQNFDELKKKKIGFWSKIDEIKRLLWTIFSPAQVIINNWCHYFCSKNLPSKHMEISLLYDNTFTRIF